MCRSDAFISHSVQNRSSISAGAPLRVGLGGMGAGAAGACAAAAGSAGASTLRPGNLTSVWHFGQRTLKGFSGAFASSTTIRCEHCGQLVCTRLQPSRASLTLVMRRFCRK